MNKTDDKRHKVPSLSQYIDVSDQKWKHRAGPIVALKMILDYLEVSPCKSSDEIIKIGCGISSAYETRGGWTTKGLMDIATGEIFKLLGAYREFGLRTRKDAFGELQKVLKTKPCITTIRDKRVDVRGIRYIVVTKITPNHVYYSDPASLTRKKVRRRRTIKSFLRIWGKNMVVLQKERYK